MAVGEPTEGNPTTSEAELHTRRNTARACCRRPKRIPYLRRICRLRLPLLVSSGASPRPQSTRAQRWKQAKKIRGAAADRPELRLLVGLHLVHVELFAMMTLAMKWRRNTRTPGSNGPKAYGEAQTAPTTTSAAARLGATGEAHGGAGGRCVPMK